MLFFRERDSEEQQKQKSLSVDGVASKLLLLYSIVQGPIKAACSTALAEERDPVLESVWGPFSPGLLFAAAGIGHVVK